jgi:hypothetical protein
LRNSTWLHHAGIGAFGVDDLIVERFQEALLGEIHRRSTANVDNVPGVGIRLNAGFDVGVRADGVFLDGNAKFLRDRLPDARALEVLCGASPGNDGDRIVLGGLRG